jgi:tetratricopeptide (TPR) repeat protein
MSEAATAQALYEQGRRAATEGDVRRALGIARELGERWPAAAEGPCLEGVVARMRGDLEKAEAALGRALALEPDSVAAHLELARLRLKTRDLEDALDHVTRAVAADPGSAEAFHEMGRAYEMRGELDEAERCLRRALELDPELLEASSALGWVYLRQKKHAAAIGMYERVLERDPENVDVQHLLGYALVRSEQYARGVELFSKVCERTPPRFLAARVNLGNAYFHVGRFDAAMRVYEQILSQEPSHFEARWNRSHLLLSQHRFEEGWRDYEFRVHIDSVWTPRPFPFRPWEGEPLEGKTLLVIAEQALGDQIMFASCVPDVLARAERVLIESTSRLATLFRRSFPGATVYAKTAGDKSAPWLKDAGPIDYQVFMGSIARLLRNRWRDFPEHRGYLRADPERVAHYRERLAALGPGRKIGLSWRGGSADTRQAMRSMPLERLAPILAAPGCRFVSLQYGDCAAEIAEFAARSGIALAHWQEAIDDYDETAALVDALDQVVSVCTSVIHLGGALGRPVWVMVPAIPEWRYAFEGERLPWYPTVRLFRQARIGDWDPLVARIRECLDSAPA